MSPVSRNSQYEPLPLDLSPILKSPYRSRPVPKQSYYEDLRRSKEGFCYAKYVNLDAYLVIVVNPDQYESNRFDIKMLEGENRDIKVIKFPKDAKLRIAHLFTKSSFNSMVTQARPLDTRPVEVHRVSKSANPQSSLRIKRLERTISFSAQIESH